MRLFQIGFENCGEDGLGRLLHSGGVPLLYGAMTGGKARLPQAVAADPQMAIHCNVLAGRAALDGFDDVDAFLSMERTAGGPPIENFRHFARLAEENPGARFILNTRDMDDWLLERIRRDGGRYVEQAMERTGMSKRGLLNLWADDFHRHQAMVHDYFRDRPGQLFDYDVDRTPAKELARFVRPWMRVWPWQWRYIRPEAA